MIEAVRNGELEVSPTSGPVAQLGARFHGMEEVVGSIPTRSTKSPPYFRFTPRLRCRENHQYTGMPRRITITPAMESRKLLMNV